MTSNRDLLDALNDILTEARFARAFVHGVEYEAFTSNPEKQRAVIRSLEIIGEAARTLPDSLRTRDADVPWREIVGMRDRLIHGYRGVNLQLVWDTVQDDLLPLIATVKQMLKDLE